MMIRYANLVMALQCTFTVSRITDFDGNSEFKKVTLNWQVSSDEKLPETFKIKFCENQIWGEHFCREQLVKNRPKNHKFSTKIFGRFTFLTFQIFGTITTIIECFICNIITDHKIT